MLFLVELALALLCLFMAVLQIVTTANCDPLYFSYIPIMIFEFECLRVIYFAKDLRKRHATRQERKGYFGAYADKKSCCS
jgi:hypothetical protein